MNNKPIYFPGLNGLRAISALAVVVSHITLRLGDFNLDPAIFGVQKDGTPIGLQLGEYGVSIFFVLSGFLITYLLQVEKEINGINIKKFYMRRILRIWPLYYAYLLLAVITIFVFNLEFSSSSFLFYFFYAANIPTILGMPLPFLHHYWSLGVEEQFYLFWPWLIRKLNRYIIPILVLLTVILIGSKLLLHVFYPGSIVESTLIITRFHCMMMGAIASILYMQKHVLFLKIVDNKPAQLVCWIIIFLAAINRFHIASIIDNEIIAIVAVVLIVGQVNVTNRIINLENKVFDFLGKISYGIYVIHLLVIFYVAKMFDLFPGGAPGSYILIYSSIVGITILAAYISYNYFEKPFLKLKKSYTVVKSSAAAPNQYPPEKATIANA